MADKITVRLSELEDVYELAQNLREDDINELKALKLKPIQSLLRGYIFSDECFSAEFRGKVIGMFGYSGFSMPCDTASVWFLGSNEMSEHPTAFVRDGKKYIKKFLNKYPVLTNMVDIRNTSHIIWLKHMGMVFSGSVFVNGYEFVKFYKRKG